MEAMVKAKPKQKDGPPATRCLRCHGRPWARLGPELMMRCTCPSGQWYREQDRKRRERER